MDFRVSPLWWPLLAAASPLVVPYLALKTWRFSEGQRNAAELNKRRIASAEPLDLPLLQQLELTVIVEAEATKRFRRDAGVSYFLKSPQGGVLMDVGFGPERPAFSHNASILGFTLDAVDAVLISHLHLDHMGGMQAQRSRRVTIPARMAPSKPKPCYVPDMCQSDPFDVKRVDAPQIIEAGLATTGPLARMLFFMGLTEEQALIADIKDRGLVIVTGCGHPTIEVILQMARRLSARPIHAIIGGLHFPMTRSRSVRAGIQIQQLFGTGKPVWERLVDTDLTRTIAAINAVQPHRVLVSPHDSCEHAIERLRKELSAEVDVLRAGDTHLI